ncbi:MAG: hypothetical protein HY756_07130 [Nitrospirae bacterium]|nr:hypothetical protein [Nitrospirota bacterium]
MNGLRKRHILFVAYSGEDIYEGFSYALDLARTMDKKITVLILRKKPSTERFDDLMTAVTFAEANEHEVARAVMAGDLRKLNAVSDMDASHFAAKGADMGIAVDVYEAAGIAMSAIKEAIKRNTSIDMIILSPAVTENGGISAKELSLLVKKASRPVVTMSRHALSA